MNGESETKIVTETPEIEIDGKFFKTPFEAEKYLVQKRGMSVRGAQAKVKEMFHRTLNAHDNSVGKPTRRSVLGGVIGMVTTPIFQGLGGDIQRSLIRYYWNQISQESKGDIQASYLHSFFPRQLYATALLNNLLESPVCDGSMLETNMLQFLSDSLERLSISTPDSVRDTMDPRYLIPLFSEGATRSLFEKAAPGRSDIGDIGGRALGMPIPFVRNHMTRKNLTDVFNNFFLMNPLFQKIMGGWISSDSPVDSSRVFSNPLMYVIDNILIELGCNSYGMSMSEQESVLSLAKEYKRLSDFLNKYPHLKDKKMTISQQKNYQYQLDLATDPNWYHGRACAESVPAVLPNQVDNSKTQEPDYPLSTLLDLCEGVTQLAKLLGYSTRGFFSADS